MDNSTLIALVTLVGIFICIVVAMFTSGVDGALKLMGAVGTLFGAIVGAIGSHYFTMSEVKSAESIAVQAIEVAQDYRVHVEKLQTEFEVSSKSDINNIGTASRPVEIESWAQLKSDFDDSNARLERVLNAKELYARKYDANLGDRVE